MNSNSPLLHCNQPLHLHAHLTSLSLSSPLRLFTSSCLAALSRFLSLLPCVSYFLLFNPLPSFFHSFINTPSFFSLHLSPGGKNICSSYLALSDRFSPFLIITFRPSRLPLFSLFVIRRRGRTHTHTLQRGRRKSWTGILDFLISYYME